MTEKKHDDIFVEEKDVKEYQGLVVENIAWTDTIKEAIITSAKARQELKIKVLSYWERVASKYHLDEKELTGLDLETGKIIFKGEKK